MLRIQIKTNIAKDKAYSALLLSSTRICLTLDFLLKIVEDTNFYKFLNFQLLKYQSLCFPTLSNRNQHQTDSNSVLHLQILKNILLISSSSEKKFSCHQVHQPYYTCLYLPCLKPLIHLRNLIFGRHCRKFSICFGKWLIANFFHDQTIFIKDCEHYTIGHCLAEPGYDEIPSKL